MIVARHIPLSDLGPDTTDPFLRAHGSLPVSQTPALAIATTGNSRLLAYAFYSADDIIGYAIVQIRHKILAEVFHGPIVRERPYYLPCVDALKLALRRQKALVLRVLPPYDFPRPMGGEGHFSWSTSIVDLSVGRDDLLKSFAPNHRQSIRKGLAAGITVLPLKSQELEAYVRGYTQMFEQRGIATPMEETRNMLVRILALDDSSGFILSAARPGDGAMAGGGIFLISGDTCTYYQGWSVRTDNHLPILHTLLWEAMSCAIDMGCKRFDLSGYSLDPHDKQLQAINDFKRWFRGEILTYPATAIIPLYGWLGPLLQLAGSRL